MTQLFSGIILHIMDMTVEMCAYFLQYNCNVLTGKRLHGVSLVTVIYLEWKTVHLHFQHLYTMGHIEVIYVGHFCCNMFVRFITYSVFNGYDWTETPKTEGSSQQDGPSLPKRSKLSLPKKKRDSFDIHIGKRISFSTNYR